MDYKEKYLDILRKYYDAIEDAIFFMNIVETEMKLDFSQERLIYVKELNSVKKRLSYFGILFKSRRNYQHPEWTWNEWRESFKNRSLREKKYSQDYYQKKSKEEKKKHNQEYYQKNKEKMIKYAREYYQKNKDKWREYNREKKKHE